MLTIYHSNQLDLLKSLTAQLIKRQPLNSVFDKEVILVQSQGMGQWLQIQLAEELGICANIEYPFPTQFVWNIYRVFHPNLPKNNSFSADFMLWVLLAILPDLVNRPNFSTLKHYFQQDNEQKYYQLATSIADLFDQYLVYRPDWIQSWQEGRQVAELGNDQEWQALLWCELVAYSDQLANISLHRADIHQAVIHHLNQKKLTKAQKNQLPKRIFIFGIVSIPPLYLELLNGLSQHIDVHFMFMNPCRQYWGDIVDHSFINKYVDNEQMASMMLQESHPLLASWGKLGRDHLVLLQHYNKQDIDAFFDYEEASLLGQVQQSILDMQNNTIIKPDINTLGANKNKQLISAYDDSISLHACHSEQREVEVLYDYLLSILDDNPTITLNDCVVMVADIDHYAPYIQAVFDNAPKSRQLPYTISDQKFRYLDPIIQGFFLLLELPQSRLDIESIFDLLEIPAIAKRFNLNDNNLKSLQRWIVDSGIRFGLESVANEPHSWLSGLSRMLLGYSMESKLDSWQDVFPYDGATGIEAELVGYLSDFIMAIAKWRDMLCQPHHIAQWQTLCSELLDAFFMLDAETEPLLLMIQEQWQHIIEQATLSSYRAKIGVKILHELLQAKFAQHSISHRFLIGKINFCTMMPMRSVPFKIVCLLGMNDGVYPRSISPIGFDLIAKYRRIGDRSRRNDDRYLFLEALLSAQQKLYISYIGCDIQTNDIRYPSILVDELVEYLKQNYKLEADVDLADELSAIELTKRLTTTHSRTPFNIENYINNNTKMNSYADEWLPAAKYQGQQIAFITPLTKKNIANIHLDELKQFYFHPIKALTKYRLGYLLNYIDEQLPDSENFNLNNLERYAINNQIMEILLPSDHIDEQLSARLYRKMLRSNQLPYGAFGQILYNEQQLLIQPLIEKIKREKMGDFLSLDVNLSIHNTLLIGRIKNIQADGILQWRSAKLTIKDGISLWLDHLIISVLQPDQGGLYNRIYGRDGTKWCFNALPKEHALELLSLWVEGFLMGINQPLFMPLQSSWHWLEAAYDEDLQRISHDNMVLMKAKNSFIAHWQGNIATSAECDDYYLRLYPQLTDELVDSAIEATKMYLLPIMQYRNNGDVN
ncbi:exodeoxyribonuclease V subunit gamma [Orbus sturtevantii]|uniref:exodeoxyribonuclease V subunit gamma n=1 Tax=Orbus sturtevantii TaxID=3074109 RepID=UPI00370D974F